MIKLKTQHGNLTVDALRVNRVWMDGLVTRVMLDTGEEYISPEPMSAVLLKVTRHCSGGRLDG
jgi:hypothetical protein